MNPRIEVVAIDCLMVRLFDVIAEANMPWMLAATERLRNGFGPALVDLVPSYTTLMVHYDLTALTPAQARALIDQAEARGRSAQQSLDDWAAETSARTERYERDAQELAAGNQRALARGMTMLRNDPTFGDAAAMIEAVPEEQGALYVAVSLGMPKESLRSLALDAHKAGAKIVIRGLVNGSFEQTLVAAKEVFGEDAVSGVAIEPQVFRAFGVDRVPTFIAATAPVQPCDQGVDCTSAATPHDRLAGNITLAEALRIIAERGDEAPGVAQAALARLEG